MKTVEFMYYVTFGKNDSSDWVKYFSDLTDEEYAIYEKAIADKKPLNCIPELNEVISRVYSEIEQMEIQNGIDNEDEFVLECQGLLEDEEYDEDFVPESPFDVGWDLTVKFNDPNFDIFGE